MSFNIKIFRYQSFSLRLHCNVNFTEAYFVSFDWRHLKRNYFPKALWFQALIISNLKPSYFTKILFSENQFLEASWQIYLCSYWIHGWNLINFETISIPNISQVPQLMAVGEPDYPNILISAPYNVPSHEHCHINQEIVKK